MRAWEHVTAHANGIMAVFTILIFFATTAYTVIATLQWCTMRESNQINRDTLIASNRPWIRETSIHITEPLKFLPNGDAVMGIAGILENTGHSPAIQTRSNSKLVAISMTKLINDEITEKQDAFCTPLRRQPKQLLDTSVFPGDDVATGEGIAAYSKDIQSAMEARSTGPFRRDGYISFAVIICVDYQLSFSAQHHQTRYALNLGAPSSETSWKSDIKPEGTHPEMRLIYFSQSTD